MSVKYGNDKVYHNSEQEISLNIVFDTTGFSDSFNKPDITINVLNSLRDHLYSIPCEFGIHSIKPGYEYMISTESPLAQVVLPLAQVVLPPATSSVAASLSTTIPDKVICIMAVKSSEIYIQEIKLYDKHQGSLLSSYGLKFDLQTEQTLNGSASMREILPLA